MSIKPDSPAAHLSDYMFKPGHSGNPGGRPKGIKGLAPALRRFGGMTIEEVALIELDENRSVFERAAAQLITGLFHVGKECAELSRSPLIDDDGKVLRHPDWRLFNDMLQKISDRVDGTPVPTKEGGAQREVVQSITLKGSSAPPPALEAPKKELEA